VVKWKHIVQAVIAIDQESTASQEIDAAYSARRLVLRARHERRESRHNPWVALGSFALAASLAVLLGFVILAQQQHSSHDQIEALGFMVDRDGQTSRAGYREGEVVSVPEGGLARLKLGSDLIVLTGDSRLRFAETGPRTARLVLEAGEVACQVEPGGGSLGRSFEVESDGVRVAVVGTRFGVSNRGSGSVFVSVDKGEVQVVAETTRVSVGSGFGLLVGSGKRPLPQPLEAMQRLRLTELLETTVLSEPTGKKPASKTSDDGAVVDMDRSSDEAEPEPTRQEKRPSARGPRALSGTLDQSRTAILEGRLDEAREYLTMYLAGHPSNTEALFLLADCERKSGRFRQAVEVYRRIEDAASPRERQRARFRGAAILQDKLGEQKSAADKLEQYLSSPNPEESLKPEAMLRLARIYLAQGRRLESTKLLEAIVRDHSGSGAATLARDLLAGSKAR
jgi:TolA-binding protein